MKANLVLLKKNGPHKVLPLANRLTTIGRRHDCDLRIPLPTVSRQHCQISQNNDSLEIHDLDSTGGTFVNDKRVNGDSSIKAGDYLRIGPLTFVCQIDGQPEKIELPKKSKPARPAPELTGDELSQELEDSLDDLGASDSAIVIDDSDSDSDLADLKNL